MLTFVDAFSFSFLQAAYPALTAIAALFNKVKGRTYTQLFQVDFVIGCMQAQCPTASYGIYIHTINQVLQRGNYRVASVMTVTPE